MDAKIKQQIDSLWATAKEFVVRDKGHDPIVFLLGADCSVMGVIAIDCPDEPLVDALTLIVEHAHPFGFIFISEAWARAPLDDSDGVTKNEALTLQCVTRDYKAIRQINFSRGADKAVTLWPVETEIGIDDSMPGVVLEGRIMALRDCLEVRQ